MARQMRGTVARNSVTLAIGDIEKWIQTTLVEMLLDIAQEIIEDVTLGGEDRMREIIEAAVTSTGERRMQSGGHPGRIDSGNMIDDVSSDIDLIGKHEVEGTFGWINALEQYYLYQEYGTNDIDAMRALQQAYVEARERLRELLEAEGIKVS